MTNSETLENEFREYIKGCVLSRRPTNKADFIIGKNAAESYICFVKPDKLFSYNPTKWAHVKDIFDIDSSERVYEIIKELFTDAEFNKVDNEGSSQYFRSNAIKQYYCFLKAREVFLSYSKTENNEHKRQEKDSLQQIFYGAPGTGKSYTINRDTEGEDVIRTTFHPDTDYSTFVGAYKPTTIEEEVMTVIGTKAVPVENVDGSHRKESKIVYEFVQQAFLQAYVAAWKKYAEANGEEPRKQFLVIEEINRGNCAQIFGDLFQLLDRNAQGFSDYPIMADADMKRQLKKTFAGLSLAEADSINAMYKGRDVCREVLEGVILLLPGNLYIWATMNTSDQSLFPIDSAFKRRWDWTYRPISDAKEEWKIKANGNLYDWWTFLEKINDKVGSLTNSEDKKLGYFFCKADSENIISAATFVGKVIFYLWNDVFKDYEFSDTIFDDGKGGKLTFDRFYVVDTARETKVVEENIALFLNNLGVEPTSVFEEKFSESDDSDIDEDNNEGDANDGKNRLMVKFSDGTFISGKTKFDSYFEALKKIGLDKVEKIASEKRYQRHGCALITKAEEQGILNSADYSYVEEQGFYIVKGINGKTMRNMLRLISQQLNLQLEVIYE